MTKEWVSSIDNAILRKCANKCTSEDLKNRGTISDILSILKSKTVYTKNRSPSSFFNDGLKIYKDENYSEAVKLFQKAAEQNVANALYYVSDCYHYGNGVGQNDANATKFYRKAAHLGHANTQYNLGIFLQEGFRVQQDAELAASLFKDAAGKGHTNAQNILVSYYKHGK